MEVAGTSEAPGKHEAAATRSPTKWWIALLVSWPHKSQMRTSVSQSTLASLCACIHGWESFTINWGHSAWAAWNYQVDSGGFLLLLWSWATQGYCLFQLPFTNSVGSAFILWADIILQKVKLNEWKQKQQCCDIKLTVYLRWSLYLKFLAGEICP